jgi:hypothetical protein
VPSTAPPPSLRHQLHPSPGLLQQQLLQLDQHSPQVEPARLLLPVLLDSLMQLTLLLLLQPEPEPACVASLGSCTYPPYPGYPSLLAAAGQTLLQPAYALPLPLLALLAAHWLPQHLMLT